MRKGIRQWCQALPFIGPALILLGLFVLYPLARNIHISFSNFDILADTVTESVTEFLSTISRQSMSVISLTILLASSAV